MSRVTVLIPTRDRVCALTATLASLCYQSFRDFSVVISDQSDTINPLNEAALEASTRFLELRGIPVRVTHNKPPKGMAHQRQHLLDHCDSELCLFLDDDVLLEPFVIQLLVDVLTRQQCGFAGNALIGLSFQSDFRLHEQDIEIWHGDVEPEDVRPGSSQWQRHLIHNAANVLHVQERMNVSPDSPVLYKVAWVGGCVMYDTARLREVGGFDFWQDLPYMHCGEDVLAQLRVARRYGGCGVLPSGAYHQELPTSIRERTVNAPEYLQP